MDVLTNKPVVTAPHDSAANDELQRFVYIASHDLSAPARQVKAFLGMLEESHSDSLNNDAKDLIRYAIGSAEFMQRQLADLLQFSRVETESQTHTQVDLNNTLSHALEKVRAFADSRQAHIESGELPVVIGDEQQLTGLFEQAISNAIKHNQNPLPSVHISASTQNNMHVINVLDNGETIEAKHRESVFDMFHRLQGADNKNTGAGLAIARRIARCHGGDLVWADQPVMGNCLRLLIPAHQERISE